MTDVAESDYLEMVETRLQQMVQHLESEIGVGGLDLYLSDIHWGFPLLRWTG